MAKRYAVIPARSGSKGLPGKNVKPFAGKPLIAWTIKEALLADSFDQILVSTDCPKIARISKENGAEVPFLRPKELASDTAKTAAVVLHLAAALQLKDEDRICLLQPTSPLRTASDIMNCGSLLNRSEALASISVVRFKLAAGFLMRKRKDGILEKTESHIGTTNRQEALPHFYPNGAVYWFSMGALKEAGQVISYPAAAYEMDQWRSLDIDTEQDFRIAEWLFEQSLNKKYG